MPITNITSSYYIMYCVLYTVQLATTDSAENMAGNFGWFVIWRNLIILAMIYLLVELLNILAAIISA